MTWRRLFCRHRDMFRERRNGVLFLACSCGYAVEALQRTPDERSALTPSQPAHELSKAQKAPGAVVPFAKRKA